MLSDGGVRARRKPRLYNYRGPLQYARPGDDHAVLVFGDEHVPSVCDVYSQRVIIIIEVSLDL